MGDWLAAALSQSRHHSCSATAEKALKIRRFQLWQTNHFSKSGFRLYYRKYHLVKLLTRGGSDIRAVFFDVFLEGVVRMLFQLPFSHTFFKPRMERGGEFLGASYLRAEFARGSHIGRKDRDA